MPGGTGRSRPFLHCSSFKIIIRKTAWKSSLTLFINIPLAGGDSTPIGNMHGQILCQPLPFKDTESETSAVGLFEVMTDSGFYYSFQRICHIFLDVSSVTCLCQGLSLFLDLSPLSSLLVTLSLPNCHFCFFCVIFCESLYQVCRWIGLSMVSKCDCDSDCVIQLFQLWNRAMLASSSQCHSRCFLSQPESVLQLTRR